MDNNKYLFIAITKTKEAQIKASCREQAYRIARKRFSNAKNIILYLVNLYQKDESGKSGSYIDTSSIDGLEE